MGQSPTTHPLGILPGKLGQSHMVRRNGRPWQREQGANSLSLKQSAEMRRGQKAGRGGTDTQEEQKTERGHAEVKAHAGEAPGATTTGSMGAVLNS